MLEEEEEEQEIENLFATIMKENFPNLAKEIDSLSFQEVQKAQRVPKKLDPRRNTPRHIIITLSEIKEETILKAAEEKERVTYKGVPIRLSAALAGVAQWIECWPVNQKVAGLIPSQGTCLRCGPGPQ